MHECIKSIKALIHICESNKLERLVKLNKSSCNELNDETCQKISTDEMKMIVIA